MLIRHLICGIAVTYASLTFAAQAHEPGAHVHGLATLQVAVDENILTLRFSSPLANLLGFEHMPHNESEKAAVRAMQGSLQQPQLLFIPTAAAQCVLQSVELASPVTDRKSSLAVTPAQAHEADAGHADLDGDFVFQCGQTAQLRDLQVKLFQRFPNLRQIQVEIASPQGQAAATLSVHHQSLAW